jgi:hypothetical protein
MPPFHTFYIPEKTSAKFATLDAHRFVPQFFVLRHSAAVSAVE